MAGAAPGIVKQSDLLEGAELKAVRQCFQLVVLKVQRFEGRHSLKGSIGELDG